MLVFQFVEMTILLLCVEISLVLRIDALYHRSHRVRWVVGVSLLLTTASSFIFTFMLYPTPLQLPPGVPFRGCFIPDDIAIKLTWVPILLFETLIFGLNTAKCISYGRLKHMPLVYQLVRDNSAYYLILLVFVSLNTIFQAIGTPTTAVIFSSWLPAVLSYSGCHLLLSIRKTVALRQKVDTPTFVDGFDHDAVPHISLDLYSFTAEIDTEHMPATLLASPISPTPARAIRVMSADGERPRSSGGLGLGLPHALGMRRPVSAPVESSPPRLWAEDGGRRDAAPARTFERDVGTTRSSLRRELRRTRTRRPIGDWDFSVDSYGEEDEDGDVEEQANDVYE
ncbi:uncharacterized protein BXZ73DRAFT_105458 [Epithele typhae]|uniref:uncharacterized protein n=1 Tax=Epithele typhae TaxID=378194 RepID=UPI002007DCB6|nr:uncharacterized protein BXZ73DRAFT_105458 [Epithele typhae]KAH9917634.1 hypothetical protein BXZ73DRAFT_105458 [Epithele typhae]